MTSDIINYFLAEEPTYKDTSPDYVAKDLYDKLGAPKGFSEEEFYSDILGYEAPGLTDEFAKGFKRSMDEIGILATKGGAAAGLSGVSKVLDSAGIDNELDEKAYSFAAKAGEELDQLEKKYPRAVGHRSEVDSLESALQYGGGLAGSGLGSSADILATALFTGGTSAVASGVVKTLGKSALKNMARKAGKELTEDQLEKQLLTGAMGKAFAKGAGAGAYIGSAAAETGSSYIDMLREGNDAPGVAIAAGALKGALEVIPEFGVVSRLFKSAPAKEALKEATAKEIFRKFGVNVAKETSKVSGQEAMTEAAQQAIDIAAKDFVAERAIDLFSPQSVDQMIEAGIAGAVGGAPLGLIAGAAQTVKPSAVEAPAINFQEKDIVASETPIAEALNPSSPNYNASVASDFSSTPTDLAPVDLKPTIDSHVTNIVEGSNKAIETISALTDAIRGKDKPVTSKFNREPQLGFLEGINAEDIKELPEGLDITAVAAPKVAEVGIKDITKALNAKTLTYEEAVPQAKALGYNLVKQNKVAAKDTKNNIGREPNWSHRKIPASKIKTQVVTPSGEVKTLYRGVRKGRDARDASNTVGNALFYTDDKPIAEGFASYRGKVDGEVVEDQMQLTNTLTANSWLEAKKAVGLAFQNSMPELIEAARSQGYDSITFPSKTKGNEYIIIPENIKKQSTGVEYSRRDNPDPAMYDDAFESLRMMNLKTPEKIRTQLKNLEGMIRDIVGPNADVRFYESMNMFEADVSTPLRGAQWSNVVAVAIGANETYGTSSRETALHEAFHFIYNNVLSQADKNRIANSKEALAAYIAKEADVVPHDIKMFDAEEIGATAFGIWADKKASAKDLSTAGRVFQKIQNILKAIRNVFRKQGISSIEGLFEDIAQGKFVKDTFNEILENERLIRTQKAVKAAHRNAADFLITPQAYITPQRVKDLLGKIPDDALMDFTRWNEFIAKKFNTSPGLAAKDPVWSVIFNVLHSKDKNMSIYDSHFANSMRELYDDRQRMVNAAGVMDHLSDSNQSVKTDPEGRVFYRKGKNVVTLTPEVSADVLTLHKGFQDMLKLWRDNAEIKLREVEGFNTIEDAIAHQQAILDKSKDPNTKILSADQLSIAKRRMQELSNMKDTFDLIEKRLISNKAYFPRISNGKFGVTVRKKSKPDEPVRQGFAIIGTNMNGKPDQKQLTEVKKRWADELGYTDAEYTFSEAFELNRNKLRRSLGGESNINLDILASLLIGDNPALADEIQNSVDTVKTDISKMYINKNFLEQNDLLLYSKDYAAVVPSYFSAGVRSVNNFRYSDAVGTIRDMIDTGFVNTPEGRIALSEEQQKFYKEQFDYVTKSSTDMAGLRAFNFMFALGGNVSTGVLQLITLPTFVTGIMNTYTGNPLTNNARIAKNFKNAVKMLADSKFDIDKFGDSTFLKKHIKDEKLANAVKVAYDRGEFRPARADDMLGENSFTSGKPGTSGYMKFIKTVGKKTLAFPVQTGEEISRIAAFMSLYETLSEPGAIAKFEGNFVEGNPRWHTYKDLNSDVEPAVYAALYAIDETHGMFGKLGRGKNQQGWYGAMLFPFMQHPLMMMGLMNRLINGNAVNKQAAAYILLSTMLLAGLYGIPGWELMKETFEMLYKQTTGKDIDLHHEFKRALVVGAHLKPSYAEGAVEGVLKPLGIDISRRIGMPFFFQDAIIPLMQGRGGADQFAGVAGSQVRNIFTNYDKLMSGEMNMGEALFETLSPAAFRNMYKAAAVWPDDGIRTAKGTQVMTPDEITPGMQMSKFMGFQPSQVSREYEKRNVERLQGLGWKFGYDRRLGSISRKIHQRNELELAGKDTARLDRVIANMYEDLYKFAAEAGKKTDRDFNSTVRSGIKRRLVNTAAPDVPAREQETVNYGELDLLYERE